MSTPKKHPPEFLELARSRLNYEPSTGKFSRRGGSKDGLDAGFPHAGYVRIRVAGQVIAAHRLAWGFVYGVLPLGFIDHINGDRADNRPVNLREATYEENARNRPPPKGARHGLKGVQFEKHGQYWRARIKISNKSIPLGKFATAQEAHAAYCRAATELFGEFARHA